MNLNHLYQTRLCLRQCQFLQPCQLLRQTQELILSAQNLAQHHHIFHHLFFHLRPLFRLHPPLPPCPLCLCHLHSCHHQLFRHCLLFRHCPLFRRCPLFPHHL